LLLLDEPTAGMNPTETTEMQGGRRTESEGLTILLLSTSSTWSCASPTRVIVMDEGKRSPKGRRDVRNDPGHRGVLGHGLVAAAAAARETAA